MDDEPSIRMPINKMPDDFEKPRCRAVLQLNALIQIVQGGFFLRKNPLGCSGFGSQQSKNRCSLRSVSFTPHMVSIAQT
jgi:hypothetical protein